MTEIRKKEFFEDLQDMALYTIIWIFFAMSGRFMVEYEGGLAGIIFAGIGFAILRFTTERKVGISYFKKS